MIVTRLKLTNLRAIEMAEFRFQPGMNLVVGVNGVGKTSVLDALGVCLSVVVRRLNGLGGRAQTLKENMIRIGSDALEINCDVDVHERRDTCVLRKTRGSRREQWRKGKFPVAVPEAVSGDEPGGRPLAVLFSTNRAVPSERAPGKTVAAGGVAAAFADAFASRELRLGEFAAWMNVQEALRGERPAAGRVLEACEEAVARFLPGYRNLRPKGDGKPQLWIDRDATSIPVRQLSDGERGSLALVLDLTRRLAQANPALKDPASKAEAVVLIDEIDLHLHPRWQRQIVRNLTGAFPECQFIATTHSPQVIGEVPHERIQVMADGQVYSPTHSFGVDSSRVLEEIMDANPRTGEIQELLGEISRAIGKQQYDRARKLVTRLSEQLGESDPEVTRLRTLLDFVEGKE